MKADRFRKIALGMKDVVEGAHMGHPDFRKNGKIFATIKPDPAFAMVKLTPDQQQLFVRENPKAFSLENGAWGRMGCTKVTLEFADEEVVGEVMTLAWQNVPAEKAKRAKAKRRS